VNWRFRRLFVRSSLQPQLETEQVLAIASTAVDAEEWEWLEPTLVSWREFRGGVEWTVKTNGTARGRNIVVRISDPSGRVVSKHFLPR